MYKVFASQKEYGGVGRIRVRKIFLITFSRARHKKFHLNSLILNRMNFNDKKGLAKDIIL